jgi:hypothetical protein
MRNSKHIREYLGNPIIRENIHDIPLEELTWEEKVIRKFENYGFETEIISENYFKSRSGENFEIGDVRVKGFIYITNQGKVEIINSIKESEIGVLYVNKKTYKFI